MKIDHTQTTAASSANVCGRSSFVRRFAVACAIALSAVASAQAQQHERGWRDDERGQQQSRDERGQRGREQRFDPRSFDSRGVEEQRRQQAQEQNARNAEAQRRSGRMTQEERRDLRRQINEAGVDLYPNTPRR